MREWHWKHEKSYPNPNPLVAFHWRLNCGDSEKLGEEKTRGVGSWLELGRLKYTGRYRLRGFIVIHVLQLFILVDFFDKWSGERFLHLGLRFSSSITLCGVICGLLLCSLFPLFYYIAKIV